MMVSTPVTPEELPTKFLSLIIGAVFIVGLNILVNRNMDYKLSKVTINTLVNELENAIDLKVKFEDISTENFKTTKCLYQAMFHKFEYKYFPSKAHQRVLETIKSFQYIANGITENDLSTNELNYILEVPSRIIEITPAEIFGGIEIKSKAFPIILLNLEILANNAHVNLTETSSLPNKKNNNGTVKARNQKKIFAEIP